MKDQLRILCVDAEFLIAMDIETILLQNFNCIVDIACPRTADQKFSDDLHPLVILEGDSRDPDLIDKIKQFEDRGSTVVLTTSCDIDSLSAGIVEDYVVIEKPFDEIKMVETLDALIRFVTASSQKTGSPSMRTFHQAHSH